MSMKIEARRCSEKAEAQSRKLGQRYEIAVKAVFADLGRRSEHDKTKNFDSNLTLTATELFGKSSGEDRGGSSATSKKRRGRDQWWPGQWWPPTRGGAVPGKQPGS